MSFVALSFFLCVIEIAEWTSFHAHLPSPALLQDWLMAGVDAEAGCSPVIGVRTMTDTGNQAAPHNIRSHASIGGSLSH